jgi:hypothetical protein
VPTASKTGAAATSQSFQLPKTQFGAALVERVKFGGLQTVGGAPMRLPIARTSRQTGSLAPTVPRPTLWFAVAKKTKRKIKNQKSKKATSTLGTQNTERTENVFFFLLLSKRAPTAVRGMRGDIAAAKEEAIV